MRDWSTTKDPIKPRPDPPAPELLEPCWRMRSLQKRTRVLDCGIYRTAVGLEVRCGYGVDDLLYSMRVEDLDAGRDVAEQLRQTVIDKGGFEDLGP